MLKSIMAKRVNIGGTYMSQRERNTSAGKKGSFIGKWSSNSKSSTTSAQFKAGLRGAQKAINQYGNTLDWLGGKDR